MLCDVLFIFVLSLEIEYPFVSMDLPKEVYFHLDAMNLCKQVYFYFVVMTNEELILFYDYCMSFGGDTDVLLKQLQSFLFRWFFVSFFRRPLISLC